jgi:hypothetical protein
MKNDVEVGVIYYRIGYQDVGNRVVVDDQRWSNGVTTVLAGTDILVENVNEQAGEEIALEDSRVPKAGGVTVDVDIVDLRVGDGLAGVAH